MFLVDTSVWVEIFRDKSGHTVKAFNKRIGSEHYVLCRFYQLEILQGARDRKEWELLDDYLSTQYYLEPSEKSWQEAAKIFFELRQKGFTINSPVDCFIAQIAIEHGAFLLHRDKDFEKICQIRPLKQERFKFR